MSLGTNVLFTGTWGSGPAIPVEFSYNKYRSGASMVYRIYVEIKPVGGASYFGYPIQVSANVGGQTTTTTVKNASPSQWSSSISFDSGDKTITNKTSGTTPLSITLTGVGASRGSQTYTYNLPIDPAMSSVSASNTALGHTCLITINKSNSSFTHTLQYQVSGQSSKTTLITKTTNSEYSWSVPTSLYSLMPSDKTYLTATITCMTYDGNTYIGATTCSCRLNGTADALQPTISINVLPATAHTSLTGDATALINNTEGILVTTTTSLKYGATVQSNYITNSGENYNATSKTLTSVNDGTFTFTVIDSRGYRVQATATRTLIKYFKPTIGITTPKITTEGVATFTINGTWFNGSFGSVNNTKTVQIDYGSGWVNQTSTGTGNNFTANVSVSGLDYTQPYTFKARITDKLNTVVSNEVTAQAIPIFDWGKTNFQFNVRTFIDEDLYFGKNNSSNGGECGQERRMIFETAGTNANAHKSGIYGGNPSSNIALGAWDWNNSRRIFGYEDASDIVYIGDSNAEVWVSGSKLQNFIIGSGNVAGWYWRRYKDGTIDLYSTITFSGVNASANNYSGFYYSNQQTIWYPYSLKSVITGEISGGSTDRINFIKPSSFDTTKMTYWICGHDANATSISGKVYIHIIGTI